MRALDFAAGDVQPILEDAVKQKPLPILLGLSSLKIDKHWVDAVNLLIRLRLIVADGGDEHEQIGMVVGDLGEQLDEVKCPSLRFRLWAYRSVHQTTSGTRRAAVRWAAP